MTDMHPEPDSELTPPQVVDDGIPTARMACFCGQCGAVLPASDAVCQVCLERTMRKAPERTYASEMGQIKSAMRLYFALLGVSAVTIIVVLATGDLTAEGDMVAASAMSLVVLLWAIMRRDCVRGLLLKRPDIGWYLLALGCPIATFLLASASIHLLVKYCGAVNLEYLAPYERGGWSFAWPVLLVCVQPAVFEELAFRGVIQGSMETVVGPWQAVFVSAAMFAILHLSIPSLPHLLTLGLMLGWMRMRSGSIYPGMIVHSLHNLLVLFDERSGGFIKW